MRTGEEPDNRLRKPGRAAVRRAAGSRSGDARRAGGRRLFDVLPGSWRLLPIIWPFLVIVILLLMLSAESMNILVAARSYSEGESLWSKAEKRAMFHLLRYTESRDAADYYRYREAIAIPLGDGRARVELAKADPDFAAAWQGFIEGRNHPDDIPGLIMLYRRFQHVDFMAAVIELWTEGDAHIAELNTVAEDLHALISSGRETPAALRAFRERLLDIDTRLTPLTDRFTRTLGDATRKTKTLLLTANLLAAALLLPIGILLSRRMLDHRLRAEQALELSQERFDLAVAGSNDGLWDWNTATGEMYFSPRFEQLLGFDELELGNDMEKLAARMHPEDGAAIRAALVQHLKHGAVFDVETRYRTKGGDYRWFRVRGQSVRDGSGRAVRMAGSVTDMTDRRQAATDLFVEKERALVTLASIADGVITTDTEGWVDYLNPVAEQLTGWTTATARGLPMQAILRTIDENSRRVAPNPIELVLREQRTVEATSTVLLVRNDGTEVPIKQSAAPIRSRTGEISGVVLVLHDVSRERQYVAKLSYQASHDSLTGLINRSEFEHRLELALTSAAQIGRHHAVMYLDLDQFKIVNDTCGHAAGDQLMRQVSAVLQRRLREGDTLARLGGDEFGVLLENCAPDNALRIAEELRQCVMECHFAWEARSFNIGVSIGLVNITDGMFTLTDVLSAADTACYMAKENGRNRVQVYHAEDSELTLRHGEMEWIVRLQKALEEDRFVLYAQDIAALDPAHKLDEHCEILLRMLDESGELVPPMAFIPAAERYNLMPSIDRWVVRNAFAVIGRQQAGRQGGSGIFAINLSGASIGDERFLDYLREQLAHFHVSPRSICFEITETAAIAKLDRATTFINELKSLGCLFSLDDFGAGMSSFAYLKHLPVDFLKIDGGFVKDMAGDPIDRAMVEAINSVGHVMGKQTIAEFVDGENVVRLLREIGVDFAQGYGVAKPRPFGPRLRVAATG
ncbi:MAG TPA: EAL domain-containing protein [Burkholderiales bacterium]|nr:EAL domain-containing protein [Burkholderiales bacterium]